MGTPRSTDLLPGDSKISRGLQLILEGFASDPASVPILSAEAYREEIGRLGELRGRPLLLPYLSSGMGRGSRVRLADGRWVLDFALGIGVHFFGHADPDLQRTALRAALADTVMQGNLQSDLTLPRLLAGLIEGAGGVLRHGWVSNSGAEANEIALKIIRQRRHPASEIIAMRGCFHGRTTTMSELTDRPDCRRGQPTRETVHWIPFYEDGEPPSASASLDALREILSSRRGRIAALVVELVQGEAGFRTAPRDFFLPLFEECRRNRVAIWIDEIQTFGRTGELFAFQTLGLTKYVDVVTIGKMLQCAATLFTPEMRPEPGLVSGTFAGSTVSLAVGARIVERLRTEGYLGPGGKVARLGALARDRLYGLARDLGNGTVARIEGIGAMWAIEPTRSDHDTMLRLVRRCFDAGLLIYYGGSGPYRLRLFLPAISTEAELDEACAVLGRELRGAS